MKALHPVRVVARSELGKCDSEALMKSRSPSGIVKPLNPSRCGVAKPKIPNVRLITRLSTMANYR